MPTIGNAQAHTNIADNDIDDNSNEHATQFLDDLRRSIVLIKANRLKFISKDNGKWEGNIWQCPLIVCVLFSSRRMENHGRACSAFHYVMFRFNLVFVSIHLRNERSIAESQRADGHNPPHRALRQLKCEQH